MAVPCLPPCINLSEADFSVVPIGDEQLAVRYALGALKSVGEGAMELICEGRKAGGRFASVDDFADRIGARAVNRRQIESLAGAGGFDSIEPRRAAVFEAAETILSVASQAEHGRTSGQGGLFGGVESTTADVQLSPSARWSMAQSMAAEKDAFGFYFSAHPVDRYRHLAEVHFAKSFGALCAQPAPIDGSRTSATMAVLVEDVRWRTSARGRRYAMATLSDASGQFVASCFDDIASAELEDAAKSGACGLLTVELDRKPGEEMPRVTLKRIQPFDAMSGNIRLQIEVSFSDPGTLSALSALLAGSRGGRGELFCNVPIADGSARILLGRDFVLDAEISARIETLHGIETVKLSAVNQQRLALVS